MVFFKKATIMFLSIFFLFSSLAEASSNESVNTNLNLEVDVFERIHSVVSQNKLAYLDGQNQLIITATADDLQISNSEFIEYVKIIKSINNVVKEGAAAFNPDFDFYVRTPEEYSNYKDSLGNIGNENLLIIQNDNSIVPFSDPGAPAYKNIYALARANRTELKDYYADTLNTLIYSGQPNPGATAYSLAVGYFVERVKPGGLWDYKIISGYGPWHNLLDCQFYSSREIQNAAYVGNYTYGFIGRELFSLSILLAGGDGVSIITGKKPDGEEDKAPIRRGFNEGAYF
ncbi:hypothetical protein D3C76_170220 [compost metagenome]